MFISGFLLCLAVFCTFSIETSSGSLFGDVNFWRNFGQKEIKLAEELTHYNGKAKNVIIFVGDGMDIPTQTIASYLKTNKQQTIMQSKLFFQQFPHNGLSRTYCADNFTPDSAATATAMFTGVKTRFGVLGYDATVTRSSCSSTRGKQKLKSIFREAAEANRSVGVITTDSFIGATPAATYSNSADRGWGTKSVSQSGVKCTSIASQFYDNAKDFQVLFGGGSTPIFSRYDGKYNNKKGQNVLEKWMNYQKERGRNAIYVKNSAELNKIDPAKTDAAIGLFATGKMHYNLQRISSTSVRNQEPSLSDMVKKAVGILSKNKNGFFLMVEGANVDKANHYSKAKYAATDAIELDNAVKYTKRHTKPEETLIIVTSDHGHTTNFGNYLPRGEDVLGFVNKDGGKEHKTASDGYYFTGIGYGAGPVVRNDRRYLNDQEMRKDGYTYQAVIPRGAGSHGGAPVAIYANGVKAHLFSALHEQPYIYYVVKNAACLGEFASRRGC